MHAKEAYRETALGGADAVRLVSLMYDGAVNFLRIARRKMEEKDQAGKGLYLGKATSVVGELSGCLNMEEGGEIASNLRRLYDFVMDRLLLANLRNDGAALEQAERVLEILRSGWKEMERNLTAAPACAARARDDAGMRVEA